MRTFYWYLTAYLRKHGPTVLFTLIVAIFIFSFSIPLLAKIFDRKPTTYIGLVGSYTLTSLPPVVQRQLSNGLTAIQDDGSAIGDLAERWSVEDNGQTYRFVVKKNILWHDGKTLEPTDLSYSLAGVEVISTPNDVVFKLPDVYAPFPTVASQPIFRVITKNEWGGLVKRPFLIGVGKYHLSDYTTKGQQLTQLVLDNDQDRLVYRFYLTENDAVTAFKHGKVDLVPDLSSTFELDKWHTTTVKTVPHFDRYVAVLFNNEDPTLTKNVRQALAYGTRKPDPEVRAVGPISPLSWAFFQGGKTYDYDMSKALERLLSEIPQQPLTIELTTTATFQGMAEQIKQDWEKLGQEGFAACQQKSEIKDKAQCENIRITVNLRINNFPDTSSFQALLIGQEVPSDPDQYYLWHSEQSTNFTHYKNTRIDSLLEKGRKTLDKNERTAIYQEFQEFFLEDAPAIFLRYLDSYEVQRK